MAEKTPAIRSPKAAPKSPTAKKPQKTRPVATNAATDALTHAI